MANERRSEVPTGPRDLELKDHIREVEKAAADWGVHVDALEGRFIGALLAAIRESGRTNLAVLGDIEALLERARATGEGELRRIGLMIEASQQTLSMAQQAAETSAAAGERAERVFNASVAKIAKDLSVKLLDECQQWLVLKQTQHNRRDARRACRRRRGGGAGGVRRRLCDGGMATGQRDEGGTGCGCGGRAVLEEAGHAA